MKHPEFLCLVVFICTLQIIACREEGVVTVVKPTITTKRADRIDAGIATDPEVRLVKIADIAEHHVIRFCFYDYDLLSSCDSLFDNEITIATGKVNFEKNGVEKVIEIPTHILVDGAVIEGGISGLTIESAITMDSTGNITYKGTIRIIIAEGGSNTMVGNGSNQILSVPIKNNRLVGNIQLNYNNETIALVGDSITMDFDINTVYSNNGTIAAFKITPKNQPARDAVNGQAIATLNGVENNKDSLGDEADSEIYMKPIALYSVRDKVTTPKFIQ